MRPSRFDGSGPASARDLLKQNLDDDTYNNEASWVFENTKKRREAVWKEWIAYVVIPESGCAVVQEVLTMR